MKKWLLAVAAAGLVACGGAGVPLESSELVGSDESVEFSALELPEQARLRVGSPVNLRSAPSREAAVLMVVPAEVGVTLLRSGSEQGFYKVSFQGHEGWTYGAYLRPVQEAEFAQSTLALTQTETETIMTRVRASAGYSFWEMHAIWGCGIDYGECLGFYSHAGNGGLDGAGMITKSWHVPPSANPSTCVDGHPYTTSVLYNYRYHWTQVSRDTLQTADALVASGHTFLVNSGDGWGFMDVYECRGCSYGCARRTRSATSDYIAIRRNTGWL